MPLHTPIPAAGLAVRWSTWDGAHDEQFTLTWENEGWTASGIVGLERAQYVVRLSALWHVRQFLLFRDLDEPDLWLATDGAGRWGEVNGAHRTDLDGCVDVALACTPFTATLPIRRLPLQIGDAADLLVAAIDVETLGIAVERHRYHRVGDRQWRRTRCSDATTDTADAAPAVDEFDVDEFGLVTAQAGAFRRAD